MKHQQRSTYTHIHIHIVALETLGHIPREVLRHVLFFIGEEGGHVDASVISTRHRPSLIPICGLEIPLLLTFRRLRYNTHQ